MIYVILHCVTHLVFYVMRVIFRSGDLQAWTCRCVCSWWWFRIFGLVMLVFCWLWCGTSLNCISYIFLLCSCTLVHVLRFSNLFCSRCYFFLVSIYIWIILWRFLRFHCWMIVYGSHILIWTRSLLARCSFQSVPFLLRLVASPYVLRSLDILDTSPCTVRS